ncbi:hypothetical protein Pyn_23547 [Prunus yedoensis var. nudiflora]|uniref:Uncharacterized protein n=1 Tax=Prunus yedoensis var. nudiflora TaxID=2094558 RepID=A0A315AA40_PRUYE|nr:hypothetical protein Pyn_23547 [Prunus yedoensis var. nudiflora]
MVMGLGVKHLLRGLDTNADVQIGNEGENEAAATENGEVGNEGENEEDDAEFVDSDYEFSEQEDEVLVAENVVVGGPSGEPNADVGDVVKVAIIGQLVTDRTLKINRQMHLLPKKSFKLSQAH